MRMKLVEPLRELFKDEVRSRRPQAGSRGGIRRAAAVSGTRARRPDSRRSDAGRASTCCGG
jgi:hypothetical protein